MVKNSSPPLRVDFDDVVLRYTATIALGWEFSSFFMTLAAFQRGLEVVFHRSAFGKTARFHGEFANGLSGSLFSVSDGVKTHYFRRTMGDQTSLEASMLAQDKNLTKLALARAGIRTPLGVVVNAGDVQRTDKFLSESDSLRFVVKPLRGSLSVDTHVDISAAEARKLILDAPSDEWLVEEFISGQEFRAYVVGEKCVSVTQRICGNVVGNGLNTIAELVERKNQARALPTSFWTSPFILKEKDLAHLKRQGWSPEDVPMDGTIIKLSSLNSIFSGGDTRNVDDMVNDSFRRVAVASCAVLGLPNAGVDVIISDDPARPGAFVLEANQCASIGLHTFPTLGKVDGNAVSEAILDLYFPDSHNNHRFVAASFDFSQTTRMLQSCQIDKVSLPVLKADWYHCRLDFPDDATRDVIWQALLSAGAYGRLLTLANGKTMADLLLSSECRVELMASRTQIAGLSTQIEAILFDSATSLSH